MPTTAAPTMTADEFWDFVQRPENRNRDFELIRGEVIEVSRATRKHGIVASNISFELQTYARRFGMGYVTTNDSGVVLEEDPATVVGPDVAYYTDARSFDEVHTKWGEEPPILAVEVRSPNDKRKHLNEKIRSYLRSGVKLVWLVDFEERFVSVYRPDVPFEDFDETATLSGGEVLPGFACKVADLFRISEDRVEGEVKS